ncbi:MAG: hemolysin III family protein [Eubacteriales bacterium]|nr:hemolysin III family protein [Eubacteriales bacterium]
MNKIENIIIPDYTKGEEIFNMITHIVGGGLGILATVLCVIFASLHKNIYGIVSGAIFGTTMIVLYSMSSIYHGLNPNKKAKKIFRILDHCAIFLLVAGTYTPFSLCTLRNYSVTLGWSIFGIIWALAILGITLNAIDLKKYNIISMILYLVMGWCIILTGKIVLNGLNIRGFLLLLFGGISYSIGAIFYVFMKKTKYMHSVFHIFVLIGSLLHFLCILLYVM